MKDNNMILSLKRKKNSFMLKISTLYLKVLIFDV